MSEQTTVTSCAYPGCRDQDGNPRLTRDTICQPSRARFRNLIDWITIDYLTLKRGLPKPVTRTGTIRRTVAVEFGHPAEWASDLAAGIAAELNGAEDSLREHCRDDPPPHPGHDETRRVAHAHRYLTARFDELCTYPGAPAAAQQLEDLHRKARAGLGLTRTIQLLPTPCPRCEARALASTPGEGNDNIRCRECGHTITPKHYGLLTRIALDDLIDSLDLTPQP